MKRMETPGPEYFDAFLSEFHRYQRSALLEESKTEPSLWARICGMMAPVAQKPAWAWSGAALALVLGWMALGLPEGTTRSVSNLVETSGIGSTLANVFPGEVDSKGSPFDRDFVSARFVTGEERLLAYDTNLTF
ncbi:MAG: hypothetical protein SNJ84_07370 [Verrucomicrobiia bacterium]